MAGGKGRGQKTKQEKGAQYNRPADEKHNGGHGTVVSVGDVGYTFRKEFDDGWYTGKVVKIRSGAEGGYDRRCRYEDGDSEDLSLRNLQTLALLDPEVTKIKPNTLAQHEASKSKPADSGSVAVSSPLDEKSEKAKVDTNTALESHNRKRTGAKSKNRKWHITIAVQQSHRSRTDAGEGKEEKEEKEEIDTFAADPISEGGLGASRVHHAGRNKGGGADDVRRSGRATKIPRKVDEIYNYEHVRMTYAKKKARGPEKALLISSTLEDIIPLDKAAEYTYQKSALSAIDRADSSGDANCEKKEADEDTDDSGEDQGWLEKVAASLGAAADTSAVPQKRPSRPASQASPAPSLDGPPVSTITCRSGSALAKSDLSRDGEALRPSPGTDLGPAETADGVPTYLSECAVGSRHGCLVFHKNDIRRLVCEVIVEKDNTWVGVAVDGTLKSYRASHLVTVQPARFKEGDTVPSGFQEAAKRAAPSKKPPAPSPSEKKPPALSVDHLFCWFCERCNANNAMLRTACRSCEKKKTPKSQRSILLEVAEKSTETDDVTTIEAAMDNIPASCKTSIPEWVIDNLLRAKTRGRDFVGVCSPALSPAGFEHLFAWFCGYCTMQNNYKRTTCSACLQGKGGLAERSPLFRVAEDAATTSNTTDEAMSRVHPHERPLIPKVVMDVLVTCLFKCNRNGQLRRCRKPKFKSYDYCEAHIDPILLSQPRADSTGSSSCHGSLSHTSSDIKGGLGSRIAAINDIMPNLLKSINAIQVNEVGLTINSIEDSVLCGENAPFPLGMKVRKFFSNYGFHDGRIIKVARKLWVDDAMSNTERPVLVYRLKYNDGDQEDFLHHEISSLREIYDICNVSPEAPPEIQIKPGSQFESRFGKLTVIRHVTPPEAMNQEEGGILMVQCQGSNDVELDLLNLQLAVICKTGDSTKPPSSPVDTNKSVAKPVLEWPSKKEDESIEEESQHFDICEGLSLHKKPCNNNTRSLDHESARFPTMNCAVNNPCDVRPGCTFGMWDPAGCYDFLAYDAYATTVCNICGIDKDDNRVIICDGCHSGFHTYCLRPVMVNIPQEEWFCSTCALERPGRSNAKLSFEDYSAKMCNQHSDILKYLGLPYKNSSEFFSIHSEAISLFLDSKNAVKQRAIRHQVQYNRAVFDVGHIKFLRNPKKNDWRLPKPLLSEEAYTSSTLSMVSAMQYCGMKSCSVDHTYSLNVTEEMNDPSLEVDEISPMSKRNILIFQAFKHNTRQGVFPPVQIIHDENFGFSVKALSSMPRHTIIEEYLGEIVTMEQSSQSSSDSLMVLLDTGDPKTSLIIDPTHVGNIARFLSGINNRSLMSKRKASVRTRRFVMDGKMHVCLFTSRRVEAGEILTYDYNAGNEGKDVGQWAHSGFYDTSNFF